ncbi:MAG: GTPase [Deltaproteobacteria bacterium]|nr:GTPase [Deltaproteobacteria bacterium]
MPAKRVLIMGAAGRDFHNFNVVFRDDPAIEVVGFTATQIPNIEGRRYPAELAGPRYPKGIPIYTEKRLKELIVAEHIDAVYFAYSDVAHEYVLQQGSAVLSAGADFLLLSPAHTQLKVGRPVIAVTAVRTGCGKSQTSRKIVRMLAQRGKRVIAVRHPMPYGDLTKQIVQRFASHEDLDRHHCTVEEREEFEPYLDLGLAVYAGIDYARIARAVEQEADLVVWDGGNNDVPFFQTDLHITVLDPLRAGHERRYFPGEVNFLQADVLVINKYRQATGEQLEILNRNIGQHNPTAQIIHGDSRIVVDDPRAIAGKRVLVIEDGPTVTHGGMGYGAGFVAAREHGAAAIVDPRPHAVGSIRKAYQEYAHLSSVLPALGYYPEQLKELEQTINATPCDLVLVASPIDIRRVIAIARPSQRIRYELEEIGKPDLAEVLAPFLRG